MVCPLCGEKMLSERTIHIAHNELFRKRKCKNCGHTFYTVEFQAQLSESFKKEWNQHCDNTFYCFRDLAGEVIK